MSKLYLGGIPTEPDVTMLLRKYPLYEPGLALPYEDIEDLLEVTRKTTRFKTVTGAWRRRILRQFNEDLSPRGGKFVVLHPHERVNKQGGRIRTGVRIVGRSGRNLAMVPRKDLTEVDALCLDHFARRASMILDADRRSGTKEISAPAPTNSRY